jgi:DNA-binding winged helix-turn-helix (wHTH) protein
MGIKIVFIDTKFLASEKLSKLISSKKGDTYPRNDPYVVTLHDPSYTTEDFLKDLKMNKELIEELIKSNGDDLLVLLNDGVRLKELDSSFNYDFKDSGNLQYKCFRICLEQQEVYVIDKRLKLTSLEYKLLIFFIYNAKKLLSSQTIVDYLWDANSNQSSSEVKMYTHIKNLKKKIINSGVGNFIHSIYGKGYKFEDPEEVIL